MDRAATLVGEIGLGANRPGRREPELEAGCIGTGHEERIERPYRQAVDVCRDADEEIAEEQGVGGRPIDRRCQRRRLRRRGGIGGCGEPLEDPGEDLAGRLAGKRRGKDVVDLGPVGEEADQPCRQGVGLAGAGTREHPDDRFERAVRRLRRRCVGRRASGG